MTSPAALFNALSKRVRRSWRQVGVRRWRDQPYTSAARPIVVAGCGRSGTTLMRVILDTHPNICCGPESHLLLPHKPSIHSLAKRFGLPLSDVETVFRQSRSQAEFIDLFFAMYAASRGKPRWAEKTPRHVHHLDFLFTHFPQARFIHMVRDGRDTVCSLRTHPRHKMVDGQLVKLNTWHPIEKCVSRWVDDVGAARRYRDDPRYLEVRYEDLIERPRQTLEKVFGFLDEPFDERVLNYQDVQGQSRDVSNFPQNPEATTAMYTRAVSRWTKDLSDDDKRTFKRMAGPLLIELGYAVDDTW